MTAPTRTRADQHRQGSHRRDACGAPARVLVVLTNGSGLVFCEHHERQHRKGLKPITVVLAGLPG